MRATPGAVLVAIALVGCEAPAPPPAKVRPPVTAPAPPPPVSVRVILPRSGLALVAPLGTRAEAHTIAGADRIVLPGGAALTVRDRYALDGDLDAHIEAVRRHRVRRFVAEVARHGDGEDFLYVHRLEQMDRPLWAVRRAWPSGLDGRVCAGDAGDRATADAMVALCLAIAPLPGR